MKKYAVIGIAGILLLALYFAPKFLPPSREAQYILNKAKDLENITISLQDKLPADVTNYLKNSINFSRNLCKGGKLSQARSILWEASLVIPYNVEELKPYLWIRENIQGKNIISWWDYGKKIEKIGLANPIVKYPSSTLVKGESIAGLIKKEILPSEIPAEEEAKVSDVSRFLTTTNETESICIAKKYEAEYALISKHDLLTYYWFEYQLDKEKAKPLTILSLMENYTIENRYGLKYGIFPTIFLIFQNGKIDILPENISATVYYWTGNSLKVENVGSLPPSSSIFVSPSYEELVVATKESMLLKLWFAYPSLKGFKIVYEDPNFKIFKIDLNKC